MHHTERLADSDHLRRALRSGETERIALPSDMAIDCLVANLQPREVLVLPLTHKDVVLGAAILASTSVVSNDSLRLLELLRRNLGLALRNALNHHHLQHIAAVDPLTGAYNRRFGMARLREELSRAHRSETVLGVIMCDIDHSKAVNDTYGHLVGDRVLMRVAHAGHRVLREGDVLVRDGGEELLAILPGASREDAAIIAERMRHAVHDAVVTEGDQSIRVTLSAGVNSFPEDAAADESELIQHAGVALYRAKEEGRNRVVTHRCFLPPAS